MADAPSFQSLKTVITLFGDEPYFPAFSPERAGCVVWRGPSVLIIRPKDAPGGR